MEAGRIKFAFLVRLDFSLDTGHLDTLNANGGAGQRLSLLIFYGSGKRAQLAQLRTHRESHQAHEQADPPEPPLPASRNHPASPPQIESIVGSHRRT